MVARSGGALRDDACLGGDGHGSSGLVLRRRVLALMYWHEGRLVRSASGTVDPRATCGSRSASLRRPELGGPFLGRGDVGTDAPGQRGLPTRFAQRLAIHSSGGSGSRRRLPVRRGALRRQRTARRDRRVSLLALQALERGGLRGGVANQARRTRAGRGQGPGLVRRPEQSQPRLLPIVRLRALLVAAGRRRDLHLSRRARRANRTSDRRPHDGRKQSGLGGPDRGRAAVRRPLGWTACRRWCDGVAIGSALGIPAPPLWEHTFVTAESHAYVRFRRAIERGSPRRSGEPERARTVARGSHA